MFAFLLFKSVWRVKLLFNLIKSKNYEHVFSLSNIDPLLTVIEPPQTG